MSYALIDALKKAHPVSQLYEVFEVHRIGYYYWQAHREPSAARIHLPVPVKALHTKPTVAVECWLP